MTGFLKRRNPIKAFFVASIVLFISFCSVVQADTITKEKKQEVGRYVTELMNRVGQLGIQTQPYSPRVQEEVLRTKFEQMNRDRWRVYFTNPDDYGRPGAHGTYKPEYRTPENFQVWRSRYPYPMAFAYNLANPNFNASIIKTLGCTFLAVEAPSDLNKEGFYELIGENKLGCLVKLNSPDEYPQETYFPYWHGWSSCNLFLYNWPHRRGADPATLLQLVKSVQVSKPQGIIGVSCRAGAGRSGTFIAAYMIVNEIDRQLKRGVQRENVQVDIDRIIWEISVQRPFAITHNEQYITLYRLVDLYLFG